MNNQSYFWNRHQPCIIAKLLDHKVGSVVRRSLLPGGSAVVGAAADGRIEGKCLVQVVRLACPEAGKYISQF